MNILNITDKEKFMKWEPEVKDKHTYDLVKADFPLPSITYTKCVGWTFVKMCYITKDTGKVVFDWKIDRTIEHPVDFMEPPIGRVIKWKDGEWSSSGLWLERVIRSYGFIITDNQYNEDTGLDTITLQRMPRAILKEGDYPGDYPYFTLLTVPLSVFDEWYKMVEREIKAENGWAKEIECYALLEKFVDWKYNPIQWCLNCKKKHGGAHRLFIAPLLGRKTVETFVMKCWWKGYPFDYSTLYDWSI